MLQCLCLCVERGSKFLARKKGSSRGKKIPREEFGIPREELVPRDERFVSIGEVHDQTMQAALNYWTRVFAELMDMVLELVRRSKDIWASTFTWKLVATVCASRGLLLN